MFTYEEEDGLHDLWKRTIMKFYSRILGDRDYSLFEVMHNALRLPHTLSSFGDVKRVSVSTWTTIKSRSAIAHLSADERVITLSELEQFNFRCDYKRSAIIQQ